MDLINAPKDHMTRNSGCGKIECRPTNGTDAHLSELFYHYPLKMLMARFRTRSLPVQAVYVLSYGGGLVDGDVLQLQLQVRQGARLMVLTQASTKVFKRKPRRTEKDMEGTKAEMSGRSQFCFCSSFDFNDVNDVHTSLSCHLPLSAASAVSLSSVLQGAQQTMVAWIEPQALLCLLPEPVAVFRNATYAQQQVIEMELDPTLTFREWPSLCLLDWFTCGRESFGESWLFHHLIMRNTIYFCDKHTERRELYLRDGQRLNHPHTPPHPHHRPGLDLNKNPFAYHSSPFHVYATVILLGPLMRDLVQRQLKRQEETKLRSIDPAERLLWSVSPLTDRSERVKCGGQCWQCLKASKRTSEGSLFQDECTVGALVRVAAVSVDEARLFLCEEVFPGLESVVGENLFARQGRH